MNEPPEWPMAVLDKRRISFLVGRAAMMCAKARRVLANIGLAVLALVFLAACERDSESALRTKLGQWFFLGQTAYFESRSRCTGAMIHVTLAQPRANIAVQTNLEEAKDAFRADGMAAIQIDGMTPAQLTDALLLSGQGTFGKQALAAGALAVSCFQGTEIGALLFEALNRPGAMLAYDMQTTGLMILDPDEKRLFYVAGDVW